MKTEDGHRDPPRRTTAISSHTTWSASAREASGDLLAALLSGDHNGAMAPLTGKTVVLLESRMASEMADLIRRQGGTPLSAPAMQEVPLPQRREALRAAEQVIRGDFQMTIFLTGVGLRAFIATAEAAGKKEDVLTALRGLRVVCRGPKPLLVCRQNNIPVFLVAPEPNTSEDLLAALREAAGDLQGSSILLQHYGVANEALRTALQGLGARVTDLRLYEWGLPDDVEPVKRAIEAMISGNADALLLTSQQQARNLFVLAERFGLLVALKHALAEHVVVGSVGPVVSRTLAEEGITPEVVPDHPKMGVLVRALGSYWEAQTK